MKKNLTLALASVGISAISAAGTLSTVLSDAALAAPSFATLTGAASATTGAAGVMQISAPTSQAFGYSNGSGLDRLTYSGSQGMGASFGVGTSNNAGINTSAESTKEYNSKASSTVNLSGCSSGCQQSALTNVIGVAEKSYNNQTSTDLFVTTASSKAAAKATADWEADYESYQGKGGTKTSAEWQAAYTASYNSEYKSAFAAMSSSSTASSVQNATGVITGNFTSVSSGTDAIASGGGTGTMSQTSTSTVTGIGAKSTFAAGTGSSFTNDVSRNGVTQTNALASGNASAGMNLSTNASASANSSNFTSVFVSQF